MFGQLSGNDGDRCPVCRGNKTLEVVVQKAGGRYYRSLPEIECDACDGRGYVMTAARVAASQLQAQK
jgi:hypothetical protein